MSSEKKRIDFNDQKSIEKVLKDVQKSASKKSSVADKVISFATDNIFLTIAILIYFIVSGLIWTILSIINHPFITLSVLVVSLSSYFIHKLIKGKNGRK